MADDFLPQTILGTRSRTKLDKVDRQRQRDHFRCSACCAAWAVRSIARGASYDNSSTTQLLSTGLVNVGHHSDAQSFRDAILVCRSRRCTYSHVHFRDC
jgi:hypothetical protein